MKSPRSQHLVIGAIVLGSLLAHAAVAMASQKPARSQASVATSGGAKPASSVDQGKADRAARIVARRKAADAAWSALGAARREPKSALKGITLTASEKQATGFIAEQYLDRSEELNKADKNGYWTATDTSTLMGDIAVLRLKQRAALRAALTREKHAQFDSNVATLVAKEGAG